MSQYFISSEDALKCDEMARAASLGQRVGSLRFYDFKRRRGCFLPIHFWDKVRGGYWVDVTDEDILGLQAYLSPESDRSAPTPSSDLGRWEAQMQRAEEEHDARVDLYAEDTPLSRALIACATLEGGLGEARRMADAGLRDAMSYLRYTKRWLEEKVYPELVPPVDPVSASLSRETSGNPHAYSPLGAGLGSLRSSFEASACASAHERVREVAEVLDTVFTSARRSVSEDVLDDNLVLVPGYGVKDRRSVAESPGGRAAEGLGAQIPAGQSRAAREDL